MMRKRAHHILLKSFPGKGKRAVSGILLAVAAAVIVIVFSVLILNKNFGESMSGIKSEQLKLNKKNCQNDYEANEMMQRISLDNDLDKCVDTLDPCLGGQNADSDIDGMPDDCDVEPDDPKKYSCKDFRAKSQNYQCCTRTYADDSERQFKTTNTMGYYKCEKVASGWLGWLGIG